MNSSKGQVFFESGKSRYQIADYAKSIQDFEQALNLKFDAKEIFKLIASCYYKTENYEKANNFYSQYLLLEPNDLDAIIDSASSLYNLGKYKESIELTNKGIQINPNSATAHLNRAFALYMLENYEQADKDFDKIISLDKSGQLSQEIQAIASKHPEFNEENFRDSIWVYASICKSVLGKLDTAIEYAQILSAKGNLMGSYLSSYYALLGNDKKTLQSNIKALSKAFSETNDNELKLLFENAIKQIR
jgi:tetratricopeptide (TPR) repeat protein